MYESVRRKYRNRPTDGYDSKREATRARELRALEWNGAIRDLREQVKYELIPAQYALVGGKQRCVERAVTYTADFVYRDHDGNVVVEDAKSPVSRTQQYVIKRKLMLERYGLRIREV